MITEIIMDKVTLFRLYFHNKQTLNHKNPLINTNNIRVHTLNSARKRANSLVYARTKA